MKKTMLRGVAAAAILSGTAAYAADIPVYSEPVMAPAPVAVAAPMWTGFYVGGQVGYAFDGNGDFCVLGDDDCDEGDFDDLDAPAGGVFDEVDVELFGDDDEWDGSVFGGAHVGFDWQMGGFVFGGLVDANWVHFDDVFGSRSYDDDISEYGDGDTIDFAVVGRPDLDDQALVIEDPDGLGGELDDGFVDPRRDVSSGGQGLDWYGTARLRAGYAFGRALIYGTGGLAFGDGSGSEYDVREYYTYNEAVAADPALADGFLAPAGCERTPSDEDNDPGGFAPGAVCSYSGGDDSGMSWGWALGGGVEFLATDRLSVGLEYLYVDLEDSDEISYTSLSGEEITFEGSDNNFHTLGVRASFRFGG